MANLQFPTPKRVGSTAVYRVGFQLWLDEVTGDNLTTASVSAVPPLPVNGVIVTGNSVTFTVGPGGTPQLYRFDIAFATQLGRADTKSVFLKLTS